MTGLVLFVIMEMAWIAPVALIVDALIAGSPSPLVGMVALFYPVAIIATSLAARIGHRRGQYAASVVSFFGVAALALMIVLPDFSLPASLAGGDLADWLLHNQETHRALGVCAVALFCWIRGTMLAGHQVDSFVVALGFQIGLGALMSVHVVSAITETGLPGSASLTAAFVGAGLLALWHARASQRDGQRRDPAGAVIGLVLVLGFGAAIMVLATPGVIQAAIDMAGAVLSAIGALIVWFFSLFPDPQPEAVNMPPPETGGGLGERPPERPLFQPMDWMRIVFGILFFGGFAVLVALMLLINLRDLIAWLRRQARQTPGLAFDRSPHGLSDTLKAMWKVLCHAIGAWARRLRIRLATKWAGGGRIAEERRLYATFQTRLTARGWPRRAYETPTEYAGRMQAAWPGAGGDLTMLTKRFNANRYGERSRPQSRLRRLWKKIRRSLNRVPFQNDQDNSNT